MIFLHSGTTVASVHDLIDTPVALAHFYSEITSPRIPLVAVASGHLVYIYRNLRPYKKFTCPELGISPIEEEAWRVYHTSMID